MSILVASSAARTRTIPPSNDDFRSENLSCSCRCRFLWQARPQELALRSSPNLLEDGTLSNFATMNFSYQLTR